MRNSEEVVIFVTDMEEAIRKLSAMDKQRLAMNVMEEYAVDEIARLLAYNPKAIRRLLPEALGQRSQILLATGMMDKLPW
jgi:hypothetical protein